MRANLWMQGIHAKRGQVGHHVHGEGKLCRAAAAHAAVGHGRPNLAWKEAYEVYEWIHLKSRQLQYFSHAFFVYLRSARGPTFKSNPLFLLIHLDASLS